jgi:transcriptional regulator of heat shock response
MVNGYPREHLAQEARVTLQAHEELSHLLTALTTASTAQLTVDNEENRQRVLEIKQWLLNGIEQLNIQELSQQTIRLADRALDAGQADLAQRLSEALTRNRHRFEEVRQQEAQVHARWESELDDLRGALVNISQRQRVQKAYRSVPELRSPRFLDGRR